MVIIGLSGGIGHGKTTFAEFLALCCPNSQHFESSDLIIAVANDLRAATKNQPPPGDLPAINRWLGPLPDILAKHVGTTPRLSQIEVNEAEYHEKPEQFAKLNHYLELLQSSPELADTKIDVHNKATFRSLQQWLGGYLVGRLGGIWYMEIVRRIQASASLELATVGGVRFPDDGLTLQRAGGRVLDIHRPIAEKDRDDPTERERQSIQFDALIDNNGSLDQLKRCAGKVITDLENGQLDTYYQASTF